MKKTMALLLVFVLALSLTACSIGGSGNGEQAKGSVYYLSFKPEQDEQWKALAKAYTQQTGVEVTVVTAASGTYEEKLLSEIAKTEAPTLFQVNGPVGLANWKDYCYDLSESEIYQELISDVYALTEGESVYGIAYVIESYGIIVNKGLLKQAGYTVDDIKSFSDLKRIAEDITARSATLGFAAFTSPGMHESSDWRFKNHLANLPIYFEYQTDGISTTREIKGTYLDNYRDIWDLYINNTTCAGKDLSTKTGDDSRNEFLNGKAVFYQNGSWEYANLTGKDPKTGKERFSNDDLAMIPIYIGVGQEENQGLCTGTENYWCVNKDASEEDIKATLAFIHWCVTSEQGTRAMAKDLGFVIPFKKAVETDNIFVQQDAANTAAGKQPVSWSFSTVPSEEWKNGVGQALTAYAAEPTDGNWEKVGKAFVEGWASEYQLQG